MLPCVKYCAVTLIISLFYIIVYTIFNICILQQFLHLLYPYIHITKVSGFTDYFDKQVKL